MFRLYSSLELRVSFCFYNRIANAVDDIVRTINSSLQYYGSITLCFNSILKVLMSFYQCVLCFTHFCKSLVCILLFSLYLMANFSLFQHVINIY